jgi:tetratricopeptide (TPR) repeat protein
MPTEHFFRSLVAVGFAAWMAGTDVLAQTSPRAARLEASAWDSLQAREFERAATLFRDALAGDPKNVGLHLGSALASYATRRDAEAKASLERALALDPKQPEARELLGRVLYRQGDLDSAIRAFDAMVEDGAADADITETLERWRREAALRDRMHVAVGHGVTVAFEGPEDAALAEQAVASLERAATRIWNELSHYPTRSISVVLYTNEQFRDITRSPSWAAGSFDGMIRVPMRGALTKPEELDRVLAHEYVHALIYEVAPSGVPMWLNEGLAAALEDEQPGSATAAAPVPLTTLGRSFGRMPREDAERAYGFSAYAVRRLLDDAGGYAVMNLIRDLGANVPFEAAFEHRIQRTLADFEAALAQP